MTDRCPIYLDGALMLTWDGADDDGGATPTALLTVRGKDHDLTPLLCRQIAEDLLRAADDMEHTLTHAEGIAALAADLDALGIRPEDIDAEAWEDDDDSEHYEIRRNEDGTVDEVVAFGPVHLEQMDTGHWSLIVGGLYLDLHTSPRSRAAIHVTVVEEPHAR